jgi:hypothetical protein
MITGSGPATWPAASGSRRAAVAVFAPARQLRLVPGDHIAELVPVRYPEFGEGTVKV